MSASSFLAGFLRHPAGQLRRATGCASIEHMSHPAAAIGAIVAVGLLLAAIAVFNQKRTLWNGVGVVVAAAGAVTAVKKLS
jgi:hypothetical protein